MPRLETLRCAMRDKSAVDSALAGGSCPYCGQPIAAPPDSLGESRRTSLTSPTRTVAAAVRDRREPSIPLPHPRAIGTEPESEHVRIVGRSPGSSRPRLNVRHSTKITRSRPRPV